MLDDYGYTNGYIQRLQGGKYEGSITIEGIQLPAIVGVYFQKDGKTYLWLKRKKVIEYDYDTQTFTERDSRPRWEAYLEKQMDGNTVAFKGEFTFLRFRFSIVGVWDAILGRDNQRLNLYVERLPMNKQTIINAINNNNSSNG